MATGKFLPEDAPKSLCTMHTTVHICTESGKMSRVFCPEESLETVSLLNLYRYFAIPNVVVNDEQYTVHFEGLLSDRILSYYYPAVAPEGNALEGQCTIHVTPPETTTESSTPENTEEPPPEESTPPSGTDPVTEPPATEATPPATQTSPSATEPPTATTPAATNPPESTSETTTPAATVPSAETTTPAAAESSDPATSGA